MKCSVHDPEVRSSNAIHADLERNSRLVARLPKSDLSKK